MLDETENETDPAWASESGETGMIVGLQSLKGGLETGTSRDVDGIWMANSFLFSDHRTLCMPMCMRMVHLQ